MGEHLFDHVRTHLEQGIEDRVAYIRAPRWIGYSIAKDALTRLDDLLARPPGLRPNGLMIVGPYANGKTMIAERFAVNHLKIAPPSQQKVWIIQTREGAGLTHFYSSILQALKAPFGTSHSVHRKAEQIDHLFQRVKPRILIFDEFHNALRGRAKDTESVFSFLRRIGRQYDISCVLIGDVSVYDAINATTEMASRFDVHAVARWRYNDDYLTLLDSLEAAIPLAQGSNLSDEPIARRIYELSEGLIGQISEIVTKAAIEALRSGKERISQSAINKLCHIPVSTRRQALLRDQLL
ncbi:TniB family NTP-binding protein [Ochrobactrum sp. S1502_03]|uniref:TniB family NTP-binding protein n=1 Tax=Brucella/Ochrobactrum group TaxID=2826938 RepID=UPI0037CC4F42